MRLSVLLLLLCLPSLACAATMRQLLESAMEAQGERVALDLEGPEIESLRKAMDVPRIKGTARRIKVLPQPGCGRYEIVLHAGSTDFASVKLNLCPGGSPPDPNWR